MSNTVLIEKLNNLVADSLILSVKLHTKRSQLHSGFELTGKLYSYFLRQYEELGDLIIQLGGLPVDSVEDTLNAASLKAKSNLGYDDFSAVLADFETMRTAALNATEVADPITQNKLISFAADLDKAIWTSMSSLVGHEHHSL